MRTRAEIARSASGAVAAAAAEGRLPRALVGFDGFVDSIVRMVDVRGSMNPQDYVPIRTIAEFAARCGAAAGKSTNIERVLVEDRFGGNGPLMAGALSSMGCGVTFVGAVGAMRGQGQWGIHPLFTAFAQGCERVVPIGEPSHTLCMEFEDGKLMFNDTRAVQGVTWGRVVEAMGAEVLKEAVSGARMIGVVNWSLLGGVEGIWEGLRGLLESLAPGGVERRVFVDLSDPAKRLDADLVRALGLLARLEATPGVSVTLGLNLSEATRVARVAGCSEFDARDLCAATVELRSRLGLNTVVVHLRESAAAAEEHRQAWFDGPFTRTPRLSTGAGDHFNAGFAMAQCLGMPLDECLCVGCAVSGAYVRDARSPDTPRLIEFLNLLPEPEKV